MTRRASFFAAGLLLAGSAAAQDDVPEAGASFDFDLNSVLVASFEADQPFLESEADRVRRLVEDALGQAYVVVRMAEVPAFTDYSAEIYLKSCPQGQYIGCVFVVGGRAQTDWTIGGRVAAVEGGYQVDLSFIDVDEAKLVLEFDVVLDGSNDGEFREGVQRIMDALVTGQVQELDVRRDPEAERAAQAEAERRARLQEEFADDSRYEDPDEFRRGDVGLDAYVGGEEDEEVRSSGTRSKVTFQDLEEMEEAGGLPPWEKAGINKGQYRLYRNSGQKLRDFKARLQGRKGEVLIKGSFNVGSGPWGQVQNALLLVDNTANLNDIQQSDMLAEFDQQGFANQVGFGGLFELGYGVAPWVELSLHFGFKSASSLHLTKAVREGIETDLGAPDVSQITPWFAGARIGLVPMPAFPARPTLHVGASYYRGTAYRSLVALPDFLLASNLPSPGMILAHINPGVDVSAGKWVSVWARFDMDIPVVYFANLEQWGPAGSREQMADRFAPTALPAPPANPGFGLGGSLGLTVRIRVAGMR